MHIKFIIKVVLAAFLTGCASAKLVDRHPAQAYELKPTSYLDAQDHIRKIIEQCPYGFLSMVIDPSGGGGVSAMKKWTVSGAMLSEAAPTSTDDEISWHAQRANLGQFLSPQLWFGTFADDPQTEIKFRPLSAVSYELIARTVMGFEKHVFIFPAHPDPFPSPKRVGFNHMSAPVAISMFSLMKGDGLKTSITAPAATTVLRHDLSKTRPVYIDASFPPEYEVSVEAAIREWNQAYRREFYVYGGRRTLDRPTCLMSSVLCLFWQGSSRLALSGYGALTVNAYDPGSGLIEGGFINFTNSNHRDDLTPLPAETSEALKNANTITSHLDVIAKLSIAADRTAYASPDPVRAVQAVVLHEMGHDAGYRHYFMGSVYPDTKHNLLSDTVMDYMPSAAFATMDRLGRRDIKKVNEIYFDGPPVHEINCSDADLIVDPYCKPQDLGATEDWLIRLAKFGNNGVLTNFNEVGGVLILAPQTAAAPLYQRLLQFILPDVQVPNLPKGIPAAAVREVKRNYAKFRAQIRSQLAFMHKGVTESVSQKVKAFLCSPTQLAFIRQGAAAEEFADVQRTCAGISIQ